MLADYKAKMIYYIDLSLRLDIYITLFYVAICGNIRQLKLKRTY